MRRVVSLTVAAAVLLSAGVIARADALECDRVSAIAEFADVAAVVTSSQQRTDHLRGALERAEDDTADRAAVLAERPGFLTELEGLRTALGSASGKVDTAAHLAAALSAQQSVLAESSDPTVVTNATATVHALTEKVSTEVTTWQAAQVVRSAGPGGPAYTTSGPDGYARVRAALDLVGGRGIGLYESSSCAGGNAPACANSNGYIKYRGDIAGWSADRLNWAMAHELAHIYQFQVWGSLNDSSAYATLFAGDPEFLANCMAVVRGYPGNQGCNGDQQAWASGIWVGAVR